MVEIEIGVMVSQCLGRGIADKATLVAEVATLRTAAIQKRPGINWMFTVDRAHLKRNRSTDRT